MKLVQQNLVKSFLEDAFHAIQCPPQISQPVIEGLIETSLRGVDSHGIRLAPHYIEAGITGRINLNPHFEFKETSETTAILDADHAYGIAAGKLAMKRAIELAQASGMGSVAVKNSSHFAAAAIYTLMAAREHMIGLCFSHSDALVLPFGGIRSFLGTNPFCFAAPCEGEDPFCLDMATSLVSWNKIMQHRTQSQPLPAGLAVDKNGKPCTNPQEAAALFPMGGYKGFGLAMMVEIFSSLLTGMAYGRNISKMFPVNEKKRELGHFFMVLEISRFQDLGHFKARMKKMLDELRAEPSAEGQAPIQVPNDPEKKNYAIRIKEGIPFNDEDIATFRALMQKLNMDSKKYPFLGDVCEKSKA